MLHEVCNANLEDHRGMISALGNVEKRQKKRKYQLVFPFFFYRLPFTTMLPSILQSSTWSFY